MVKSACLASRVASRLGRPRAAALVVVLSNLSFAACVDGIPTETTLELPIVASAAHLGDPATAGAPFVLEMSQELTATVTGDPDGVGTASLTLNAGQNRICWSLTATNIALPATASHIHRATAGLSGPIVLGLTPPDADGSSSGCALGVDRQLIVDILDDPSQYYVNVHTTEHPPGAIRAQLR